jgi:prepilin-type N-terminal cleavage/methylation domain-containing protein
MLVNYITQQRQMSRSRGFTMVELLIVIAIILILFMLLMPALNQSKEKAAMMKCQNNMRQIYKATWAYAADYDGYVPYDKHCCDKDFQWYFIYRSRDSSHPAYSANYPQNKWFAEYFQSLPSKQMNSVGHCPKGGIYGPEYGPTLIHKNANAYYGNHSYGFNDNFQWSMNAIDGADGISRRPALGLVWNPTKVALIVESATGRVYPPSESMTGPHYKRKAVPYDSARDGAEEHDRYLYKGKATMIYVDQHMRVMDVSGDVMGWSPSNDPNGVDSMGNQVWKHDKTNKPDPTWE